MDQRIQDTGLLTGSWPPRTFLVNATTVTEGGGVQAAVSFVEYAARLRASPHAFVFALSAQVHDTMAASLAKDTRIHRFTGSPAHPWFGRHSRTRLLELEAATNPSIVYSIGFPSYVTFRTPEVGRYTNGWEICFLPTAWQALPLRDRPLRALRSLYRLHWAKNARYFETQTEIAKAGIVEKLGIHPRRVLVSPNAVNPRFVEAGTTKTSRGTSGSPFRLLSLAAGYPHKNLSIIPKVGVALREQYGLSCRFVVTLPIKSSQWRAISGEARRLGVDVENTGPLDLDGCVQQYLAADALFLPTLAEIFSATYLEAMAMRVPVITTDLDFARATCGGAAVYFDPLSHSAAAHSVNAVLTEPPLRARLIAAGIDRLATYPDPETKQMRLLEWLSALPTQLPETAN